MFPFTNDEIDTSVISATKEFVSNTCADDSGSTKLISCMISYLKNKSTHYTYHITLISRTQWLVLPTKKKKLIKNL